MCNCCRPRRGDSLKSLPTLPSPCWTSLSVTARRMNPSFFWNKVTSDCYLSFAEFPFIHACTITEVIELAQRGETTRFNMLCDNSIVPAGTLESIDNGFFNQASTRTVPPTGRVKASIPVTFSSASIEWESCNGSPPFSVTMKRNSRGNFPPPLAVKLSLSHT